MRYARLSLSLGLLTICIGQGCPGAGGDVQVDQSADSKRMVLAAVPDQTSPIDETATIHLSVSGGSPPYYYVPQKLSGPTTDIQTTEDVLTLTPFETGTLVIRVSVYDSDGNQDQTDVTVFIEPPSPCKELTYYSKVAGCGFGLPKGSQEVPSDLSVFGSPLLNTMFLHPYFSNPLHLTVVPTTSDFNFKDHVTQEIVLEKEKGRTLSVYEEFTANDWPAVYMVFSAAPGYLPRWESLVDGPLKLIQLRIDFDPAQLPAINVTLMLKTICVD